VTLGLSGVCTLSRLDAVPAPNITPTKLYRRAGGLRFLSLTSELGEAVATLTPALLEAVLRFQPPPRQQQQWRQRPKRRRKSQKPKLPLAELLPRLLARAPQQVLPHHSAMLTMPRSCLWQVGETQHQAHDVRVLCLCGWLVRKTSGVSKCLTFGCIAGGV
jgi:hypothetical protein